MVENGFLSHLTPFREGLDGWEGWWTGLVLSENLPLRDSVGFRPTSSLNPTGHPFPKRLVFNIIYSYEIAHIFMKNLPQLSSWYSNLTLLFEA